MGNVLEDGRQAGSAHSSNQGLEAGSDQGQGAGGIGIAQTATILAPTGVPLPVFAFAGPMSADDLVQALWPGLAGTQAADKMARGFLDFPGFLVRRVVAYFHELAGFREIRRLRIGGDRAQLPPLDASVSGIVLAKRGRAGASWFRAC